MWRGRDRPLPQEDGSERDDAEPLEHRVGLGTEPVGVPETHVGHGIQGEGHLELGPLIARELQALLEMRG